MGYGTDNDETVVVDELRDLYRSGWEDVAMKWNGVEELGNLDDRRNLQRIWVTILREREGVTHLAHLAHT